MPTTERPPSLARVLGALLIIVVCLLAYFFLYTDALYQSPRHRRKKFRHPRTEDCENPPRPTLSTSHSGARFDKLKALIAAAPAKPMVRPKDAHSATLDREEEQEAIKRMAYMLDPNGQPDAVPDNLNALRMFGSGYREDIAQLMVFFCRNSYCLPISKVYHWQCKQCASGVFSPIEMDSVFIYDAKQTVGYLVAVPIAETGAIALVLTFRGTMKSQNWVTDLDYRLTSWNLDVLNEDGITGLDSTVLSMTQPPGLVHSGFFNNYAYVANSVRQGIHRLLRRYGKNCHLFITGHSLGGALATMAAADLIHQAFIPASQVTLYTFGSPRLANDTWGNWFNSLNVEHYRVTRYVDIIPRLPPRRYGYSHSGREIYYPDVRSKRFVVCDPVTDPIPSPDAPIPEDMKGLYGASARIDTSAMDAHRTYLGCTINKCEGPVVFQ